MLKKTITYVDFDGNTQVEDFYFNLSKTEIIELEVSEKEGYGAMMQKIVDAEDNKEILKQIKTLIFKAYGEKSEDGKRFVKSEELSKDFLFSPAFDELIMSFFENAAAMAEFMVGLVPKDLSEKVDAAYKQQFGKPGQPSDHQKKKVDLKTLQAGGNK